MIEVLEKPLIIQDYWTDEEDEKFVDALRIHGKDWVKISKFIGTKSNI